MRLKRIKTASFIIMLVSMVLFVLSLVLNISDISSYDTHLMCILPIRYCSYCLFAVAVILLIFYYSYINKSNENIKKSVAIILIASLIGVVLSITVPFLNYSSFEYGYDIFEDEHSIDEQYIKHFPYYEKMVGINQSNDDVIYLYEEHSVLGTKYLHIQNMLGLGNSSPLYNVEYFETNSNIMFYQFENEKKLLGECKTLKYNGVEFDEYKNENHYEIRIKKDDSLYSFYVSNFYNISNSDNDLIEKAINEYLILSGINQTNQDQSGDGYLIDR